MKRGVPSDRVMMPLLFVLEFGVVMGLFGWLVWALFRAR